MKTKKGPIFFLFLCAMSALMLSVPSSQPLSLYDGVVYANEDVGDEVEETTPPETGSNGNYENLQIPSIMSTAYADGLRGAQQDSSEDKSNVFNANMKMLVGNPDPAGHRQFDTIGLLMGPVGHASGSGTNDVASTLSMSLEQLQQDFDFGSNLGEAYWTFGRAVQNLRLDAEQADTSTIGASAILDTLGGVSTRVSTIGITLLRNWSPAPLVLAFVDHEVLDAAEHQNNELVKLVNDLPLAKNMVSFFGRPSGIAGVSVSQLIMLVMIMLGLSVSILTVFLGQRFFSVSVKKTFVKVLVMIVAVPLTMHAYDWGLQALDTAANDASQTTEFQQAEKHLLLGLWAESGFAVPSDVTLRVQDDRFVLSRSDIRKINAMLLDVETDDHEAIANEITRRVNMDNNETNISWQAVVTHGSGSNAGAPWRTGSLIEIANAVGNNQPIEENTRANLDDNAVGYIYGSGLRSSRQNGNYIYRQIGAHNNIERYTRFGLSPIASYNMLNTSFNSNGLSVKSNLSTGSTLPSVAPTAYAYSFGGIADSTDNADTRPMPSLVKWVVEFVLLVASIKALAKIITTGFGGMLHGGARSMFGASAGWGELFGAIVAAVFGVLGLSLISLLAIQVSNALYGMLYGLMAGMVEDSGISTVNKWWAHLTSPTGWLSLIPGVSDPIAEMRHEGLNILAANIMALLMGLFLLPKFIRIPIEAFAVWISSLPDAWAQKAQEIENRFTGDSRAGGRSGNALAGAMSNAGSSMLNSGAAVAAGGGMIAGAAAKAGGGAIANKIGSKMGKGKDGSGSGEKDGSQSVASPSGGALFGGGASEAQTDEQGNPITENVSDNGQIVEGGTSADESHQEGDAVGGDTQSDETATNDENSADGATIGGDVSGQDSTIADESSAEGATVAGDINADESSMSDEQSAEGDVNAGDVNAEESSMSDENSAEGDVNAENDAVSGDVNANESAVSDANSTEGDVNAENSAVSGDVSANESAVEGDVSANDTAINGETNAEGDAVGGDVSSNDSVAGGETNADGDSVSTNDSTASGDVSASNSTVAGGTNASNSSVAGGTSANNSSVAGGTSANNSSVAGGTNASNSSVAGGTSANNSSVAGGTNANNSSVAGDMSSESSSVAGGVSAESSNVSNGASDNSSRINGETNAAGDAVGGDASSNNATVGGDTQASQSNVNGDVSTSDASTGGGSVSEGSTSIGGETQATSDSVSSDVSTNDSTIGGDANGSGVNVSEGSSANGGLTTATHSESNVGGQAATEGGVNGGGVSISNDATTEGAQVTNDSARNEANINTDANATMNQSAEERTTNRDGNADNRQTAQLNSNSETVNANQSTNANTTTGSAGVSTGTATGQKGAVTNIGGQKGSTATNQKGAPVSGQKGSTATGQKGAVTNTGGQKGSTATGQKGSTATGQKGSTATGQKGSTATGQKGSTATGQKGAPVSGQKGTPVSGQTGTPVSGQKGVSNPTARQSSQSSATGQKGGVTNPTRQNGQTGVTGGRTVGTQGQTRQNGPQGATQQNGPKTAATMDRNGNVTSGGLAGGQRQSTGHNPTHAQQGRQGPQVGRQGQTATGQGTNQNRPQPRQQESTSQKAGRLGGLFNRSGAQGNVSNAQQAAMGAVHVMGGLTGTQNITQKGVDNMKRRQGKDVGGNPQGQSSSDQSAQNNGQNNRKQQIIDMERRDKGDQSKGKKPSFITQARNKGNDNKR